MPSLTKRQLAERVVIVLLIVVGSQLIATAVAALVPTIIGTMAFASTAVLLPCFCIWKLHRQGWLLSGLHKAILTSVALIVGNVLLLGLPGALLLELAGRFSGHSTSEFRDGSAWPAALLAGCAWPLSIPVAHLIASRPRFLNRPSQRVIYAVIVLAAAYLVPLSIYYSNTR